MSTVKIIMIKRAFSHQMQKVILLRDLLGKGFRGEVIQVKPQFAKLKLFKYHDAVPFFPGRREIMFPEYDPEEIEAKKEQQMLEQTLSKLREKPLQIVREDGVIDTAKQRNLGEIFEDQIQIESLGVNDGQIKMVIRGFQFGVKLKPFDLELSVDVKDKQQY